MRGLARSPGLVWGGRAAIPAEREGGAGRSARGPVGQAFPLMILPQVHLRKPCYDFYFL